MTADAAMSGAAQGAAAGASFGPWGALIGGAAGAIMGGVKGGAGPPVPPTLPNPLGPGGISGQYGGWYVDPVTGRQVFANYTDQFSPQQYYNMQLQDAIMGSNLAPGQLNNQVQNIQGQLDRLNANQHQPTYSDFGVVLDSKTGKPVNYQDYINKRGTDNPLWDQFMHDTGGRYGGSSNPDISFAKWAKDWTNKSLNPAVTNYMNAQKQYQGNQQVVSEQRDALTRQLQQLQGLQGPSGSQGSSVANNPMLSWLNDNQQENYLNSLAAQNYQGQMNQYEGGLAQRGLASSSMGELARAQGGLSLANQYGQNHMQVGQQAFNNRLSMLGYLQGANAQNYGQNMGQQGLSMQQTGLGSGTGMTMADWMNQRNSAQAGLNWQSLMGGYNQNMANGLNQQNQWNSALGMLGYLQGNGNSSWQPRPQVSGSTISQFNSGYPSTSGQGLTTNYNGIDSSYLSGPTVR